MRLIITTNKLEPGGAEMQRVHLANGLSARGHDVELLAIQSGGMLADLISPSVTVTILGGTRKGIFARRSASAALITGVTNSELGLATSFKAATFGRGRWVAASHHSYPPSVGSRNLAYSKPVATALALPDRLIALTEGHRKFLRGSTLARKIEVVPNGVPTEGTSTFEGGPWLPKRPTMGLVGRLTEQKGVEDFLRAWVQADIDADLHIWGDGPLSASLKALHRDCPTIHWRGWTKGSGAVWPQVDLLVVPSHWEAQPMIILEALVSGVPVVGSDVGGVREILASAGAGMVVQAADPSRWAEALVDLPGRLPSLIEQARSRASHCRTIFSLDLMIDRYSAVLNDLK